MGPEAHVTTHNIGDFRKVEWKRMRRQCRVWSLMLALAFLGLQGCAIPKRIPTEIQPGTAGNDRALGCGPTPELEPYVYRIPGFQAAVVVVAFEVLPTNQTHNVRAWKSSGIKEIDEAAVRAVEAWNCPLPPLTGAQKRYDVPFRFVNPLNPPPPATLSILWAGMYTAESRKLRDDASSIKGYTTTAYGIKLGEPSGQVVAKIGAAFGVDMKFDSVAPNDSTWFRYVWKFPAAGLVNPKTGIRHFGETGRASCTVGGTCLRGWLFSEEWELVPGTWTLEIWRDAEFVDSRSFEVRVD